jgi:putative ABC transport system ATP-binding protein
MMKEVLIKVRGLKKEFNLGKIKVQALKHIDLDIYRGEYLSVMGPSGSGKSTLFNMIGALDKPSAGEVEVAGVELSKLDSRKLAHFRGQLYRIYLSGLQSTARPTMP